MLIALSLSRKSCVDAAHPNPIASDAGLLHIDSAFGGITLAATAASLCGLWFDGQHHFPDLAGVPERPDDPILQAAARQLHEYFAGQRSAFDLPLDLSRGTSFQQAAWSALLHIPAGTTTTYGALAARLGRPRAVRAVAAAIGRNPISVIVPCHRVLGVDGALTGYAGGLDRKRRLLALEAS